MGGLQAGFDEGQVGGDAGGGVQFADARTPTRRLAAPTVMIVFILGENMKEK